MRVSSGGPVYAGGHLEEKDEASIASSKGNGNMELSGMDDNAAVDSILAGKHKGDRHHTRTMLNSLLLMSDQLVNNVSTTTMSAEPFLRMVLLEYQVI